MERERIEPSSPLSLAEASDGGESVAEAPPKRCPPNPHIVHRDIIDRPGYDIFGQSIAELRKGVDVECPNECGRIMNTLRISQHLEKCMGITSSRHSSRVAVQKMKVGEVEDFENLEDEEDEEEGDLEPSVAGAEQRGTKRKSRPNTASSRPKIAKSDVDCHLDVASQRNQPNSSTSSRSSSPRSGPLSSGASSGASDWAPSGDSRDQFSPLVELPIPEDFFLLDDETQHSILDETCAVILEDGGRMCDGPLTCEVHTSEQRRAVRVHILGVPERDDEDSVASSQPTGDTSASAVSHDASPESQVNASKVASYTGTASSPSVSGLTAEEGSTRKGRRRTRLT